MSSSLLQPEERVLPTLEADGSRRWLYPRVVAGKNTRARRWVGWGLIALFNVLPFLSFKGKPVVLLDLASRHFTLMGYTFLPRDTFLLALLMLAWILGVFFFTAIFGRVWCGWGCPQTVYMEFFYRPIERLMLGRSGVGGRPREGVAFWRYAGMYALFLVLSWHLANIFLSYFVGAGQVKVWVTRSPLEHPAGFVIVFSVTMAMLVDFAFLREQVCSVMCPYARLQSVLVDRHSLVVRYDERRGEPRGRGKGPGDRGQGSGKKSVALPVLDRSVAQPVATGDCVDCSMCVQVCPTGIDIRQGTQLECLNCAACVDACDVVMEKVGKPAGLIRYASLASMEEGKAGGAAKVMRVRTVVYACIITGVLGLLTYKLVTKSPVDVLLVRNQGMPFVMSPDGRAENTVRVQLTNRTEEEEVLKLSVVGDGVEVLGSESREVALKGGDTVQKVLHLLVKQEALVRGKKDVVVRVEGKEGMVLERGLELFGPG